MKKALAILLAAAVLSGFAACSIGGRSADDEEDVPAAVAEAEEKEGTVETEETEEETAEAEETEEAEAEETEEATAAEATTAAETRETTTARSASSDYKEAYRRFLLDYIETEEVNDGASFSLIYLDNDDIPELVISNGYFHYATAMLYTYTGSQVKLIDELGHYGEFAYESRKSYVLTGDLAQGYDTTTLCEYKNGRIVVVWSCENDEGAVGEEDASYRVNKQPVSKAEYDAAYDKQISSHHFVSTLDDNSYDLTREGIQSIS